MAKPEPPKPVTGPPSHHLDLNLSVRGQRFQLTGVFTLEQGMAAFDRWVKTLESTGGLTPDQVTDLLDRAEKLAKRLEGVDAATT